jgi:molecular chaperone HtpG
VLKEGVAEDYANRDEIAGLLRFTSTRSATSEADVSLADYVARMKQGQEKIYYLLAPTLGAAASSPHLEAYRDKDIEVLLLGQDIDNWVVTSLTEFDGRRLQSVAQGAPDFGALAGEQERQAQEQASTQYAGLLAQLKEVLAGKVWDVRVTSRLTTSPACIVADEAENDINLVRRMRGTGLPSKPVLEINPEHALIRRLHRGPDDPPDPRLADWAHVLYNQAVLTSGARIEDPNAYVTQLNELLVTLAGDTAGEAADDTAGDTAGEA